MAGPIPYPERRYVAEPYRSRYGDSIGDLLNLRGRREAEAELRRGDIAAQMWNQVGQTIAGTVGNWQQGHEQEQQRELQAKRMRQEDNARGLQLMNSEAALMDRATGQQREEQFRSTLAGGGGREAVLAKLQGDPEMFAKASEHFDRIDKSHKRLLGDVAAGIRTFGDDPEAAMVAMDDLIAKGFDAKQVDRYRGQIQREPQALSSLVDSLLSQSPEDDHRAMVRKPKEEKAPIKAGPGDVFLDPNTYQPIASVPEKATTAPNPTEAALALRAASGDPAAQQALALLRQQRPAAGGGASRNEPLVAVMGEDGNPVLMPRSQAAGMRPASNREQGRAVTSGDAGRITDLDTALDDLQTLDAAISEVSGSTGTRAAVGAALPNWVTEWTGRGATAKSKQAVIDRVKQVIGKALEGGVLRKEDEIKYAKILPTIGDVPEVVKAKLEGLQSAIAQRRSRTLDSLADAGYDTSRFNARPQPGGERAPTGGPTKGERRMINGQLGEWDGKGWKAVQ